MDMENEQMKTDAAVNPYAEGVDHVALAEDAKSVLYLDQTQLPNREIYKNADTPEECFDAIKKLEIRGAPCIGIFAGYSMFVLAQKYAGLEYASFKEEMHKISEYLNSSRPTAVNLSWALKRMRRGAVIFTERSAGEKRIYRFRMCLRSTGISIPSIVRESIFSLSSLPAI